ncbi:MAG TPA: hypothetical protein VFS21_38370 [Roseiflexaceae bacterium]|nr:hypothetical protein [Roseiflexaceae bacterium]
MSEKQRPPNRGHTAQALDALSEQVKQLVQATRETNLALSQALEKIQTTSQQIGELVISMAVTVEEGRLDIVQVVEACRRQNDELAELRRILGATGPAPRRSSEPPAEEAA